MPGEPEGVEAPSPEAGPESFDIGSLSLEGLEGLETGEAPSEEAPAEQAPSEEALPESSFPTWRTSSLTEPQAGVEAEEELAAGAPAVPRNSRRPPLFPRSSRSPAAEETAAQPQAGEALAGEGLGDLGLEDFTFAEPTGKFAPQAEPAAGQAPPKPPRPPGPRARSGSCPPPELGGGEAEVALTQEQFNRLKQTLESLPRNLKMAVQDVIGDGRATGANLTKLISLLVAGAPAHEIAAICQPNHGKADRHPRRIREEVGRCLRRGAARTFGYALRENIVPLVRLFALTILAAALLGFFGYRFVYRPLYALANYRIGYTHILGDRFTLANERFDRARAASHIKRWYYRYAEGFSDKRQYVLAEQKYDQLLQDFPGDRKGILDYAHMESTRLADYKKADDILQMILGRNQYDFDALLAAGDNNLEWAATENARYEAARLDYATLIEKYGTRDELLFRMLRYFIRTNNPQEIERLRLYFASRPQQRVDPGVYAELGGYLIDHRQLDHAEEVLFKAEEARPNLAEIHYNLARYYRLTQRPDDEMLALTTTVKLLRPSDPLTPKRLAMEIDTHTRLGELYNQEARYINGEKELTDAIARVEESQKNKLIGTGGIFGRPYADLGDLHYYIVGDLDVARALYQKAVDNQYFDPSLDYKIGFTQYAQGDYRTALASFAKTEDEWGTPPDRMPRRRSSPRQLRPSTTRQASGEPALFHRQLFLPAGRLLRRPGLLPAPPRTAGEPAGRPSAPLTPQESPDQRSLLELLVKVDNNLGVVMDMLAGRTGDRTKRVGGSRVPGARFAERGYPQRDPRTAAPQAARKTFPISTREGFSTR